MAEYIEREKVIEAIDAMRFPDEWIDCHGDDVISVVEDVPAADVRPVVRGRWIRFEYNGSKCSNCGHTGDFTPFYGSNFCPRCGADMRGEDDV